MHATPAQVHEALEPIIELEQAERAMEMVTCAANRQGSEGKAEGERRSVGNWWMKGGMGVIEVGETAVVHVGKTPPEALEDHRT